MSTRNRLEFITLNCHECSKTGKIDYELLVDMFPDLAPINLGNLNQLLDKFKCSNCNARNFSIADKNGELIFDMQQNVTCVRCGLAIPLPRIAIQPGTKLCIECKDEKESVDPNEVNFPAIPIGMRRKCPTCEKKDRIGIVVVYQNSKDKTFFLGCSVFPNCRWSADKYFDELN